MRRPAAENTRKLSDIDAEIERLLLEKSKLSVAEDLEYRVQRLERDVEEQVEVSLEAASEDAPKPQRPRSLLVRLRQFLSWCFGKRRMQ
jgi:hypothetical protein